MSPLSNRHYHVLPGKDPHIARRRELLRGCPEIAGLRAPSRWTLLPIAGLVTAQFGAAWLVRAAPWWQIVAIAWAAGAALAFGLLVMLHEASHGNISRSRAVNRLAAGFASLPLALPLAPRFLRDHHQHHRFVGDYEHDPGVPRTWEARLVDAGFLGTLVWFAILPFATALRMRSTYSRRTTPSCARATALLFAVQAVILTALVLLAGPGPLVYLIASLYFALGPHPLALRFVQEHAQTAPGTLTSSYYGPLNRLSWNLGYHVEHHDFPNVPWHRLPRLRAMMPQWYPASHAHPSRGRAFFAALYKRRLDLWDRCVTRLASRGEPEH